MKTTVIKNVMVAAMILTGATNAMAQKSQKIDIDYFPYVGSLSETANAVEDSLAQQAATVCGGLENVQSLTDVSLRLPKTRAFHVNPKGEIGGRGSKAIFSFGYPRVLGSAVVNCKTELF